MSNQQNQLLRNKPRLPYKGLTVILSNPSRFDKLNLLTATGGQLFSNYCLQPEYNQMQCDVRVMEDRSPLLPGTKCVMLLGQTAMRAWCPETRSSTLHNMRGSLLQVQGIPAIASYFPQDAADIRAYEQQLNEQSKEYANEESKDKDEGDVKSMGYTRRSNYAFWLRADTKRCKTILKDGVPRMQEHPNYKIYPGADEVINVLRGTENEYLYFDIETDREEQNLQCFSFSLDKCKTVYAVPILDFNYSPAYAAYYRILAALAFAIKRNTIVAHNGASFDFFVLASKYHIPVYRCYDTMLAMHRCFPDVEKSLGHCTSFWTWEKFHKGEDSEGYFTYDQMMSRLRYCGKDVYTMYLIHKAIQEYQTKIPGLPESIQCAMDSIRPYLICTLQGIRYSEEKKAVTMRESDRLMMQYLRIINLLIGESGMELCKKAVKGKAKSFAGSNKQCVEYFHNLLGYPVVSRGLPDDFGNRAPSLRKEAMYRLALKFPDNPVITFVLLYRKMQKEYSSLNFVPWKDDNGKIYNPPKELQLI